MAQAAEGDVKPSGSCDQITTADQNSQRDRNGFSKPTRKADF